MSTVPGRVEANHKVNGKGNAMEVETFEVSELTAEGKLDIEDVEAFKTAINDLELDGQKKFLPDDEGPDKELGPVNPYRKMTKEEHFVYSTVCSAKVDLSRYAESILPLRVLQVAAHANKMFQDLEVWHAPNADIEDPVLVGINNKGSYGRVSFFLLARWGETLVPFDELKEVAIRMWREKTLNALKTIKQAVDRELKLAEDFNPLAVGSKKLHPPEYEPFLRDW
jgi:hypothetical protein